MNEHVRLCTQSTFLLLTSTSKSGKNLKTLVDGGLPSKSASLNAGSCVHGRSAVSSHSAVSWLRPLPPLSPPSPRVRRPPQRQQSLQQPERHKVVVSTDGLMPSTSASYADEQDHKYARRAHPLKRTLQRLFPNMFAPGLPVTNRWGCRAWQRVDLGVWSCCNEHHGMIAMQDLWNGDMLWRRQWAVRWWGLGFTSD